MNTLDNTHCFLNKLDPDTKIYKYFPLKYVAEMFRSGKYRIEPVYTWEDVYENYFLKQDLVDSKGNPIDTTAVTKSCFGQSWSILNESDAMWRIYSPHLDSIKVRTTAHKLLDIFCKSNIDTACTFISRVNYRDQSDIEDEFETLQNEKIRVSSIQSRALDSFIVESLITKRSEFGHEDEVRLIKRIEVGTEYVLPKFLLEEFSPHDFFEELIIDPRADQITFQNTFDLLQAVGANSEIISKSKLYEFKKHTLIL